jgi:hypothetical protein
VIIYFERACEDACSWGRGSRKCLSSGTWIVYELSSEHPGLGQCLGPHCSLHALRRADDIALQHHPERVTMHFGRPPSWGQGAAKPPVPAPPGASSELNTDFDSPGPHAGRRRS